MTAFTKEKAYRIVAFGCSQPFSGSSGHDYCWVFDLSNYIFDCIFDPSSTLNIQVDDWSNHNVFGQLKHIVIRRMSISDNHYKKVSFFWRISILNGFFEKCQIAHQTSRIDFWCELQLYLGLPRSETWPLRWSSICLIVPNAWIKYIAKRNWTP